MRQIPHNIPEYHSNDRPGVNFQRTGITCRNHGCMVRTTKMMKTGAMDLSAGLAASFVLSNAVLQIPRELPFGSCWNLVVLSTKVC